jgi:hypothetical protein
MGRVFSSVCGLPKNLRNVIAREPLATVAISKYLVVVMRDCFASLAMTIAVFFNDLLGRFRGNGWFDRADGLDKFC